ALRDAAPDDAAPRTPLGLASVSTLVHDHTADGADIDVLIAGTPRPLDLSTDLAAYRIMQEALTNAVRHGRGRVDVGITYQGCAIELVVENPFDDEGRGAPASRGHGLVGMRERAALLGGVVEIARTDGTFRLRAELPT